MIPVEEYHRLLVRALERVDPPVRAKVYREAASRLGADFARRFEERVAACGSEEQAFEELRADPACVKSLGINHDTRIYGALRAAGQGRTMQEGSVDDRSGD